MKIPLLPVVRNIGDTVTDLNSTWISTCVTFSKTVNFSEPQFLHRHNGNDYSTYFKEFIGNK